MDQLSSSGLHPVFCDSIMVQPFSYDQVVFKSHSYFQDRAQSVERSLIWPNAYFIHLGWVNCLTLLFGVFLSVY